MKYIKVFAASGEVYIAIDKIEALCANASGCTILFPSHSGGLTVKESVDEVFRLIAERDHQPRPILGS
jgi:hypothetical protein